MNKKDVKLKKVSIGILILYAITVVASFIYNFMTHNLEGVGMTVVAMGTVFIIPLAFKIFKWKPVYEIYIVWYIFTYFASLIGSGFHWYSYAYFDKVLHASSGIFVGVFAAILYTILRKQKRPQNSTDLRVFLVFTQVANMSVALMWEFYEFAMLVFFNNDAIHHYDTGVYDTMGDMLCASFFGLFVIYMLYRAYKKEKPNFFSNLIEKFYERNVEKEVKHLN